MANDAFRQFARAVFGRMKGVLSQVVRSETERAVRHFRERVASRDTAPPALAAPPAGPEPEARAAVVKPEAPTADPATEGPVAQPRPSSPPLRSEVPPARAAAKRMAEEPAKKSKADAAETGPVTGEALVNVNAASRDELIALPGIGEARADAIVKGRPFKDVSELRDRKILPAGVFATLEGRIVAR